ncbi:thiamine biosynthesis protein ThiS [Jannaschia pagri]|uniref:Thiamine biosynthesis protein ThiS n=1 Tax=Jannaschia pagri TaxID=2829797 RepID=A0ABQ4NJQ1_9RHOB|nr:MULTISPECIES: sulfur carrier protein ThiS [unclassified Jannaschia]GIT90799.1 thiamine biosynthesis protein ThiS [Jannaschia sp. AI_61]GIT94631.1 thiamine biosynthesis protein ThiS [Jannaschia sp. AI_62]
MTKLTLNGEATTSRSATLAQAIEEFGFAGATVATAVNGAFVPAAARAETMLSDGDQVEILAPMQGG